MIFDLANTPSRKVIALPEDEAPDAAEHARVVERLADMRASVGSEDFTILINKACAELHALSRRQEPWSAEWISRGLSVAMLLGFDSLETACREIDESPIAPNPGQALKAAEAAYTVLRSMCAQ